MRGLRPREVHTFRIIQEQPCFAPAVEVPVKMPAEGWSSVPHSRLQSFLFIQTVEAAGKAPGIETLPHMEESWTEFSAPEFDSKGGLLQALGE